MIQDKSSHFRKRQDHQLGALDWGGHHHKGDHRQWGLEDHQGHHRACARGKQQGHQQRGGGDHQGPPPPTWATPVKALMKALAQEHRVPSIRNIQFQEEWQYPVASIRNIKGQGHQQGHQEREGEKPEHILCLSLLKTLITAFCVRVHPRTPWQI